MSLPGMLGSNQMSWSQRLAVDSLGFRRGKIDSVTGAPRPRSSNGLRVSSSQPDFRQSSYPYDNFNQHNNDFYTNNNDNDSNDSAHDYHKYNNQVNKFDLYSSLNKPYSPNRHSNRPSTANAIDTNRNNTKYTLNEIVSPVKFSSTAKVNTTNSTGTNQQHQYQQNQQQREKLGYQTNGTILVKSTPSSSDKTVLRFDGYFEQVRPWDQSGPLGRHNLEDSIVRYLSIVYYIEDNTIAMNELQLENSGVKGGKFYKRSKLVDVNNETIKLLDLMPGNTLEVLGLQVHITDASSDTREYIKRYYKLIVPPAIAKPSLISTTGGNGTLYALGIGSKSPKREKLPSTRTEAQDITYKFFHTKYKVFKFQCIDDPQSLHVDNEVLRGKYVDDRTIRFSHQASVQKYALSYFVNEKHIELRLVFDGTEKDKDAALVLKKGKTPKNWIEIQRGKEAKLYDEDDFVCGTVLDIYGRKLLIIDCDSQTKQEYVAIGIDQQPIHIVQDAKPAIIRPIPKQGDGFLSIGSPEATLLTVYGQSKPAIDISKATVNRGHTIKCKAIMITNDPILSTRRFQITFAMEDDTIQIFEETVKNTGVIGGSFLNKGKYINELPHDCDFPRNFKSIDFFLGNVICINGIEMRIVEMDALSMRFCEGNPDEFPMFDLFRICTSLMIICVDRHLDIRHFFSTYDRDKSDCLSNEVLIKALDQANLTDELNDQELLTFMRRFQDGNKYYYREITDLFSQVHYIQLKYERDTTAHQKRSKGDDLKGFCSKARGRSTAWRRAIRKDTHSYHGYIELNVLLKIFDKHSLHISDSAKIELMRSYAINDDKYIAISSQLQRLNGNDGLLLKMEDKALRKPKEVPRDQQSRYDHMASIQLDDHGNTTKVTTGINKRRQKLLTSVLGRGRVDKGADDTPVVRASIIDYHKLCDDIYEQDWL